MRPLRLRHSRSTAAIVLRRTERAAPEPRRPDDTEADAPAPHHWPRWFAILTAVLLAAIVAGLWALLLLGDSLSA